jgi:hypothetical protein
MRCRQFIMFPAFVALLLLSGCEKLPPEVISGLQLASANSKESALFVEQAAKDMPELQDHVTGLKAQAAGLGLLCDSVGMDGKLSEAGKQALRETAKTAEARYRLFEIQVKRMNSPPEWCKLHLESLKHLADLLGMMAQKLPVKESK